MWGGAPEFLTNSQGEGLEAVVSRQSDFLQIGWGGAGYLGLGQDCRAEQGRGSKSPHQAGRAALCPFGTQGLSGGLPQPLNDLSHLSDLH